MSRAKITGATPMATSNPFGTAALRQKKGDADLVAVLLARVRAVVARVRRSVSTPA